MKKLLKKIDVHAHVILNQEYEFSKSFIVTPDMLLSIYVSEAAENEEE